MNHATPTISVEFQDQKEFQVFTDAIRTQAGARGFDYAQIQPDSLVQYEDNSCDAAYYNLISKIKYLATNGNDTSTLQLADEEFEIAEDLLVDQIYVENAEINVFDRGDKLFLATLYDVYRKNFKK